MPSYAPFTGQCNPRSLASRIKQFFADNGDEMLTYGDIAIKFGCTARQAQGAVSYLRSRGLLATMLVVCAAGKSPAAPRGDT